MLTKILVYCFMNLMFALKGDGVTLSLTPESMVIGSSAANPVMSLTIKCSSDGTTDIRTVTLLMISRRKFTEPSFMGIASVEINSPAELDPQVPQDIQQKLPNVTGSIATDLKSGTLTVSLNAQGITCADQAEFSCTMAYNDIGRNPQTVHYNMNFTVLTVPNDVIMYSPEYYNTNGNTLQLTNNSVLAVGTRIKFRCMANVGSLPEGEIIWERTSELGSQNSFIPYTPTPTTDIVQEESQQSGCFYRRTSTMYYNLTKLDEDGISFRCRASSFLGGQRYESLSNQQYRALAASSGGASKPQEVDGVSLSLNPPFMAIGSSVVNPGMRLTIQCSSGGTQDINQLFVMKINRRKFTESTFSGIALWTTVAGATLDSPLHADIQQKSPNVTGSVATDLKSGILTLSLNTQGLTCADQAEFQCYLNYLDITYQINTAHENKNFTVITVPSDVIMDIPEYYNANGNALQLTNNSVMAVGTRIKFRCTANVGSLPEGEIIWERTSELGSQNSFISYTPTPATDIVQEESQQSGCFYRRTSTMYYNLTKLDDDGISFRCRAQSFLGGQRYESLSNQQYRTVAASSGGANKQTGQEAPPAQAGTIAGAVIGGIAGVVLIIVLVYFLWYRRRSSGESYRTKEEGERPEPPPTDYTYSMPDKKKMESYDNKALDDHQDKTTRYPRSGRGGFDHRDGRNDRGHHNPGMDDEDGGAMHMGHGPIGTGV